MKIPNTERDIVLAYGIAILAILASVAVILYGFLAHAAGTVPPDGDLELHIARNWDTLVTNAGISAAIVVILGVLPTRARAWLDGYGAVPLTASVLGVGLALLGAWSTHGAWVPSAVTGFLAGAAAAGLAKGYKDVARAAHGDVS